MGPGGNSSNASAGQEKVTLRQVFEGSERYWYSVHATGVVVGVSDAVVGAVDVVDQSSDDEDEYC